MTCCATRLGAPLFATEEGEPYLLYAVNHILLQASEIRWHGSVPQLHKVRRILGFIPEWVRHARWAEQSFPATQVKAVTARHAAGVNRVHNNIALEQQTMVIFAACSEGDIHSLQHQHTASGLHAMGRVHHPEDLIKDGKIRLNSG